MTETAVRARKPEATSWGRSTRFIVGTGAGLVVAAAVLAGRLNGLLEGVAGLVLAGALVALAPVSRLLARRVFVVGALVVGWVPLLWWLPAPGHGVGWATVVLASAAGALAAWPFAGPDPARRARLLLPRLSSVDALPPLTFALGIWQTWPLVHASSGDRSLNLLMKSGWDHVAHFDMVEMIRRHGQFTAALDSAPDGSEWNSAHYPEHFHGLLVGVMEVIGGPDVGSVTSEFLGYGRGLAVVLSLLAALLAAGVVQLPALRRRPLITWPIAALVGAAYVVGPGAVAMTSAFPNFVFAAGAAALAVLAAASTFGRARVRSVLLLGGLVVATVYSWAPLAVLTAVAACVPFVRVRRVLAGYSRRRRAVLAGAVTVPVLISLAVVPVLHGSGASDAVNVAGATAQYSMSRLLTVVPAACAAGFAAWTLKRGAGSRRALELTAVPLVGLFMILVLGAYQLATAGELTYYFGKIADGVSLASFGSLAVGLAQLGGSSRRVGGTVATQPRPRRAKVLAISAAALATVVATQFFGYVGPQPRTPVIDVAPMARYRIDGTALTANPASESLRLLSAAKIVGRRPFGTTTYVAAVAGDPIPALAAQWVLSLSQTWSRANDGAPTILFEYGSAFADVPTSAQATRRILESDSKIAVVVAPELLKEIRREIPVSMRSRVISWQA